MLPPPCCTALLGSVALAVLASTAASPDDPSARACFNYQGVAVACRRPTGQPPPGVPVVLLLHGAKYSSATWEQTGTLGLLHDRGVNVLAVDLPGFGSTPRLTEPPDDEARANFIRAALLYAGSGANVTQLGAVLVSPSMSGRWAAPFVDRFAPMLRGWVMVAAVGLIRAPLSRRARTVPVLAVYGENDPLLPQGEAITRIFSTATKAVISHAGHACYIDQPVVFHRHLTTFLDMHLLQNKQPAADLL